MNEKIKIRFSGRGGQGIKFLGSLLVRVAMAANYYTTLTVDYTPSVRGGPIFCDVILNSAPISYPFCDKDADIFIALDQKGFERASECIYEKTVSFIDEHTIANADDIIQKGKIHRVPFTRRADENKMPQSANILCLGFLSQYLKDNGKINLKEEYFDQILNSMPERFRTINIRSYKLGQALFQELKNKSQ
ncbi:MAG: 2-oxoacid:acceptor oxidoreductase family protein [Candidatus Lokiarchaeota archaeon]|nr:2-oxoacid:acceptor oxidoreductase family protein [Candidatus Lokiarchaeota archaeon]